MTLCVCFFFCFIFFYLSLFVLRCRSYVLYFLFFLFLPSEKFFAPQNSKLHKRNLLSLFYINMPKNPYWKWVLPPPKRSKCCCSKVFNHINLPDLLIYYITVPLFSLIGNTLYALLALCFYLV